MDVSLVTHLRTLTPSFSQMTHYLLTAIDALNATLTAKFGQRNA